MGLIGMINFFHQCIINDGALPCLLSLLTHTHKKSIKKEACWTISNITAGNKEQIQVRVDFIFGKFEELRICVYGIAFSF